LAEITYYLTNFLSIVGSDFFLPYLIIFLILTLCGLGLPIPEDIVLIVAGILVYRDSAELTGMIFICLLGVIVGDYLIFMMGRKWGMKLLNHKVFMNAFSERRMGKVHKYFDKYGNKTVFFARFVWGLRAATFFIAGTHTMSAVKFIMLDFLGALISVPLIIYLAYNFGGELEKAIHFIKITNHTILAVATVIIVSIVLRYYFKKKKISEK